MSSLREKVIRLAHTNVDLRPMLVPLLSESKVASAFPNEVKEFYWLSRYLRNWDLVGFVQKDASKIRDPRYTGFVAHADGDTPVIWLSKTIPVPNSNYLATIDLCLIFQGTTPLISRLSR